ncbi:hypothetical protein CRG98_031787 [Punica granatum]|uniref:Uncharacterized protein n=1 Tax=Punica granatum TaxID=22663 RepID=A0A2I0IWS3_PUNGR|nr:hypothetical protein CRG98_031787 [Punica granatum]
MAFVPEDEGRFRNEHDAAPLYDDGGLAEENMGEEHRMEANRDVDEAGDGLKQMLQWQKDFNMGEKERKQIMK